MLACYRHWLVFGAACLLSLASLVANSRCLAADDDAVAAGRGLFLREWIPGDQRSAGGDGLGPVFNETSCVACHNQGSLGGAGPASKNVQIISVFSADGILATGEPSLLGALIKIFSAGTAPRAQPMPPAEDQLAKIKDQREQLSRIHPGFRTARSLVLHRFSTEGDYAAFRTKLNGLSAFTGMDIVGGLPGVDEPGERNHQPELSAAEMEQLNGLKLESQFGGLQAFGGDAHVDGFTLIVSERNSIPLFGSGLLDGIADAALHAAAARKFEDYPEVSGRVARLKDGRIGRFGWKAQKARLGDFVLTACAVELGLEVPGESQSGLPQKPDYRPPGLDLTQKQCDALITFVAHLPAPSERAPANETEGEYLQGGRKLFTSVGCAACHTPQLGDVTGIYSDLLLHDMGPELSGAGSYGGFAPNATEEEELNQPVPALALQTAPAQAVDESKLIGATRQEWRTPPLWGLRDSGPYLHDGRAATIEQAIALHGGEGTRAAHQFIKLTPAERLQLALFLRSLVAPQ